MTTKQRMKRLGYAYASSPAATRLNNGKGCWLVEDSSGLPPFVFQDGERMEALKMFEAIDLPYTTSESFDRNHQLFIGRK